MRHFYCLIFFLPAVLCGLYDKSNVTLTEVFKALPLGKSSDILNLSKGLNYWDLQALLLKVSQTSSSLPNQQQVLQALLEEYKQVISDSTKVDMILADLSSDYFECNEIATIVYKSGLKSMYYLKQLALLERVIQITGRKDFPRWHSAIGEGCRLWFKYVTWMKKVGLDIKDELNASLNYAVLDETLVKSKFYQSILLLQPDKNNYKILKAGNSGDIKQSVKKDLSNYGFKFSTTASIFQKIKSGFESSQPINRRD